MLSVKNAYLLITCYLPHDPAEHADACTALSTLTITFPNYIIIIGRDFQGDLTSSSDKSCHLRTPPFTLFSCPHLPTFKPPQQPTQATCIDHLLYPHPQHINIQIRDIHHIAHAFLDHEGIITKVHLPFIHHIQPPPTPPRKTTNLHNP